MWSMLKHIVRSRSLKKLYVPMHVLSDSNLDHWGLLVLSSRKQQLDVGGGSLEWGDSLHYGPKDRITGILMDIFGDIVCVTFPAVRWYASARNCMEKKKYNK